MSDERTKSATVELAEPITGSVPVPVWWLIALVMIAFLGLGYLDRQGGGFNPKVYEPFPSLEYVTHVPPPAEGDQSFNLGKRLFKQHQCDSCHMTTGLGDPSRDIPPLAGSDWVNAEGPNRIIRVVLHGLTGPIEVSGKKHGAGTMIAMGHLSDSDIAAILTFIRGNKDFGNNAGPVTPKQVSAVRAATKDRPNNQNWTWDELKSIPVKD